MTRDLSSAVPEPVRRMLTAYSGLAQAALGFRLTAIYLHGSIALGDFDPVTSDVDFVTVIDEPGRASEREGRGGPGARPSAPGSPDAGIERGSSRALDECHDPPVPRPGLRRLDRDLRRLHRRLAREHGLARRLEGVYLSSEDLRAGDFSVRFPYVKRGRLRGRARLPVVARSLLREGGVALLGPDPAALVPPVSRDALEVEMHQNLSVYWSSRAARPWLFLFDPMVDFAVLTLPRILHTLETGEIMSKRAAVSWLEGRFPEWRPLAADARGRFHPLRLSAPLGERVPRALMTRKFVLAMIEIGEGRAGDGSVTARAGGDASTAKGRSHTSDDTDRAPGA